MFCLGGFGETKRKRRGSGTDWAFAFVLLSMEQNYLPEVLLLVSRTSYTSLLPNASLLLTFAGCFSLSQVANVPVEIEFTELETFFASAGVRCKALRREAIRDGIAQVSVVVSLEDRERMLFLSGKGAVGEVSFLHRVAFDHEFCRFC